MSFDANTHDWPHEERKLAARGIRLATWEFKVVHAREAVLAVGRFGFGAGEFRFRCMGDWVGLVGLVRRVRLVDAGDW